MTRNPLSRLARTFIVLSILFISGCTHAKQPIQLSNDINYNKKNQHLDLYVPEIRSKNTAIMFIHGGGFTAGNKGEMTSYAKRYAKQGYVTTSINYRLSLDYTYPAAVNDAVDALNWMKKNASTYGYHPDKIVLVGYSAGGTLALNVGLNHQNKVAATVSVAGITDIDAFIKSATIPEVKAAIERYMGDKDAALASPITQVNTQTPPVLLLHGDADDIVPIAQSIALEKKLKEHNIPSSLEVFPNMGHGIMLSNKPFNPLLDQLTQYLLTIEASN